MRQAGILAAAGIYALSCNIARLEQDHQNARMLAMGLETLEPVRLDSEAVQTNIVFADITADMPKLCAFLKEQGILIDSSQHLRLVTHLDISSQAVTRVIKAFKTFFSTQ
jgi:threonine aldolase